MAPYSARSTAPHAATVLVMPESASSSHDCAKPGGSASTVHAAPAVKQPVAPSPHSAPPPPGSSPREDVRNWSSGEKMVTRPATSSPCDSSGPPAMPYATLPFWGATNESCHVMVRGSSGAGPPANAGKLEMVALWPFTAEKLVAAAPPGKA